MIDWFAIAQLYMSWVKTSYKSKQSLKKVRGLIPLPFYFSI
jgi:hypothetical protein